jgi:phage FluMu protein Com
MSLAPWIVFCDTVPSSWEPDTEWNVVAREGELVSGAIQVVAEWQPSLACFCPSCKLHINILRMPVEAGSVRDVTLTVGGAHEGELLMVSCPNCKTVLSICAVKPGASVRLLQIVGEGKAESR